MSIRLKGAKRASWELLINQYPEQATKTNDCYSQLQDGVSLQFTPTVEDEGKFLVCRAENPKLPEAGIEDRWKLRVHCKYQVDNMVVTAYSRNVAASQIVLSLQLDTYVLRATLR